jgi:hypothetical protein
MPAALPFALHPLEQLAQLRRKQHLQIEVIPSSIPKLYMQYLQVVGLVMNQMCGDESRRTCSRHCMLTRLMIMESGIPIIIVDRSY